MPNKTGIRLFQELRKDETLKAIPIIVVTGIADEHETFLDFKRFICGRKTASPEAYLAKPIDKDAFIATIQKVVEI